MGKQAGEQMGGTNRKQAGKHASKQADKQAGRRGSKQECMRGRAGGQARRRAGGRAGGQARIVGNGPAQATRPEYLTGAAAAQCTGEQAETKRRQVRHQEAGSRVDSGLPMHAPV